MQISGSPPVRTQRTRASAPIALNPDPLAGRFSVSALGVLLLLLPPVPRPLHALLLVTARLLHLPCSTPKEVAASTSVLAPSNKKQWRRECKCASHTHEIDGANTSADVRGLQFPEFDARVGRVATADSF
jgi:hypothetical protein